MTDNITNASTNPMPAPAAAGHDAAPEGTRLMHRDLCCTDSVPWAGPNPDTAGETLITDPDGTCSTLFQASNGMVVGLCTRYTEGKGGDLQVDRPIVVLFDPDTAEPLAVHEMEKHGLFGGVYGYLDKSDSVIIAEGHDILSVSHRFNGEQWELNAESMTTLSEIPEDAQLAGLIPDGQERTWFVTQDSIIGVVTDAGQYTLQLGAGEEGIANGLVGRPNGVSVLTTHALYEVELDGGEVKIAWRHEYDRGSARKPGQLSWGSGTTPTFFGEDDPWVAIVDNADDRPNLIVLSAKTGEVLGSTPAFEISGQGTENSIMADGNTLWIPSTYGFEYPEEAVDGPSVPESAPFTGGLTRIDVSPDGDNAVSFERVWETTHNVSTLPILTLQDRRIWSMSTDDADNVVSFAGVDADTGEEVFRKEVGQKPLDDPGQMTGLITPDGVYWQATFFRMHVLK
nr:Uncharacterised protein [Streptococcus thermophilus]